MTLRDIALALRVLCVSCVGQVLIRAFLDESSCARMLIREYHSERVAKREARLSITLNM